MTFLGLISVLYMASQVIVLGSFSEQERQEAGQNVERVQSALSDNLVSLEGTTRDWSLWDDTYAYIQDQNRTYFDSNLATATGMESNRLNLELFVDAHGHVVFQKGINYKEGTTIPIPPGVLSQIYEGSPLLNHTSAESSIKGILSLPEGPMLIASEPILPSSRAGSMRGAVIFGRFFDKEEIQHLARASFLGLTFQPLDAPQMPADFTQVLPALLQPVRGAEPQAETTQVQVISSSSIGGYTLLRDVYGKPALVLKAEMTRDVYMRGQETVRYYMLALFGVGVIFGLVILLFLKQLVLSRLALLSSSTAGIAASGDLSARVPVSGSDELSQLAVSMNNMLSALQQSQRELKEGEERYRAVVEQTTEAIFLIDTETRRFLQANAASQILLGYSYGELQELTLDDILVQEGNAMASHLHRSAGFLHTTGTLRMSIERHYRRKDGVVIPVEVSDSRIMYCGRDVLCVVVRDITDRKRAEVSLRELAMRDGLTGLYNRREMQRILKESVESFERHSKIASLILLDVDYFKSVNDTYGHQVGDDVLRWISRLVAELVRPEDKVARYGGEELAVILPDMGIESAVQLAELLRRSLAVQPFEFTQTVEGVDNTVLVPITISLGVAVLSQHTNTVEGLIDAADQALYEAKHYGRNCTKAYLTLSPLLKAI